MIGRKKGEGKPLPETADMKLWREEFSQMTIEDHDKVLKNLGLDDEDVEEFNAVAKGGKRLEDIMGVSEGSGQGGAEETPEEAVPQARKEVSVAKKGKK